MFAEIVSVLWQWWQQQQQWGWWRSPSGWAWTNKEGNSRGEADGGYKDVSSLFLLYDDIN